MINQINTPFPIFRNRDTPKIKNPHSTHKLSFKVKWGYAKVHQYYITESGFFIIEIQPFFQFTPDWYGKGDIRDIVLHYYYVLRSVLREKPHLRKCLKRCRHCRIYFLTHPRNEKREDLGCPFGCREAYRKEASKQRSIEYYRSYAGKIKKSFLNARRSKKGQSADSPEISSNEKTYYEVGERVIDEETIDYLQTVTGLIEEREVSKEEILSMLKERVRQLSIVKKKKIDYIFKYHLSQPP